MGTRLDDIRKRRPLDTNARKRVGTIKRAMRLEVALSELREMRGVSQTTGAAHLETSPPEHLGASRRRPTCGCRPWSATSRRWGARWRSMRSSATRT